MPSVLDLPIDMRIFSVNSLSNFILIFKKDLFNGVAPNKCQLRQSKNKARTALMMQPVGYQK